MIYVTADDYGLNKKVNRVIQKLANSRKIHTVSVLANFISTSKHVFSKDILIAAHLNLIEGKPLTNPEKISSLVDSRGEFYPLMKFVLRLWQNKVDSRHIQIELEAQTQKIVHVFGRIDEINFHQHCNALPIIDRISFKLKKKYNIALIRTFGNVHTTSMLGWFYKITLFCGSLISSLLLAKPISPSLFYKSPRPLLFMSWENSFHLPKKTQDVEIVCHPGTPYDKNTVYTSLLLK